MQFFFDRFISFAEDFDDLIVMDALSDTLFTPMTIHCGSSFRRNLLFSRLKLLTCFLNLTHALVTFTYVLCVKDTRCRATSRLSRQIRRFAHVLDLHDVLAHLVHAFKLASLDDRAHSSIELIKGDLALLDHLHVALDYFAELSEASRSTSIHSLGIPHVNLLVL